MWLSLQNQAYWRQRHKNTFWVIPPLRANTMKWWQILLFFFNLFKVMSEILNTQNCRGSAHNFDNHSCK